MDSNRQYLHSRTCRCASVIGTWVLEAPLGWCCYPRATINSTHLSGNAAANASGSIGLNQAVVGTGNL